jgi:hypothetical protein
LYQFESSTVIGGIPQGQTLQTFPKTSEQIIDALNNLFFNDFTSHAAIFTALPIQS